MSAADAPLLDMLDMEASDPTYFQPYDQPYDQHLEGVNWVQADSQDATSWVMPPSRLELMQREAELLEALRGSLQRTTESLSAQSHEAVARLHRSEHPPIYPLLQQAIQKSRGMLEWEDDWDGEGSPAYREATWKRATDLIIHYVNCVWRESGLDVPVPRILPGPDGSIDIHWRTEDCEILVNVPANDQAPITYYGDDRRERHSMKGALDADGNDAWFVWLLTWLAK